MQTIRTNGTVKKTLKKLNKLARASGDSRAAREMLRRIGVVVLTFVAKAFEEKSEGGADEAGEKWAPLSRHTVAYHRKHAGLLWPQKRRAAKAPSAILLKKQRDRWWALYGTFLGRYKGNKAMAARSAWSVLKGEGAHTIMSIYGRQRAPILIENGKLWASLQPPTGGRRATYQVFRVKRGSVEVGTSRPWALLHHQGGRRVPQRRLWAPPGKWPASWWKLIRNEVTIGMGEIVKEILE